jgi:hypothetical protein
MFDYMDGMMRAHAMLKTQWKEDLYFGMKLAWQKLSRYYTEVTLTTVMFLIAAYISYPFQILRPFRKWKIGTDALPEDDTFYTAQYIEAFRKLIEQEYCTQHTCLTVTKPKCLLKNNLIFSPMSSRSGPTAYDPYDLPCDNAEYLIPNNVA